jgi:hypothetical protein
MYQLVTSVSEKQDGKGAWPVIFDNDVVVCDVVHDVEDVVVVAVAVGAAADAAVVVAVAVVA